MSDLAKWALLIAGYVIIITLVLSLPILEYVANVPVFGAAVTTIVTYAGDALIFGRGLINNLLSPWARTAVSGLMSWFVGKFFYTYSVKILTWAYHYIFK